MKVKVLFLGMMAISLAAGTWAVLKAAEAAPKTVITGKRMKLINKGEAVEFVGKVVLKRGSDTLKAHRMVSDEKKGVTRAWKKVHMKRRVDEEGLLWEAWGDRAVYDSHVSSGTLWGKRRRMARVKRTPLPQRSTPTPTIELEADQITVYEVRPQAGIDASTEPYTSLRATGRVYIQYHEVEPAPRYTQIWCGRMLYDGLEKKVTFLEGYEASQKRREDLDNRPRARQEEGDEMRDLKGDVIFYFVDSQKLVSEGNVDSLMVSPEKKNGS